MKMIYVCSKVRPNVKRFYVRLPCWFPCAAGAFYRTFSCFYHEMPSVPGGFGRLHLAYTWQKLDSLRRPWLKMQCKWKGERATGNAQTHIWCYIDYDIRPIFANAVSTGKSVIENATFDVMHFWPPRWNSGDFIWSFFAKTLSLIFHTAFFSIRYSFARQSKKLALRYLYRHIQNIKTLCENTGTLFHRTCNLIKTFLVDEKSNPIIKWKIGRGRWWNKCSRVIGVCRLQIFTFRYIFSFFFM